MIELPNLEERSFREPSILSREIEIMVAETTPAARPLYLGYSKDFWRRVLWVIACTLAGTYGILHNQISYTVSPDYFHAFKFKQFQFTEPYQTRFGASIVGFLASWWMGIIVGVPIVLVASLLWADVRTYFRQCIIAFVVVVLTALVIGLAALAWAYATYTPENLPPYWYPEGVVDPVAFARAGTMHNCSYLGGFLGIATGVVYLFIARWLQRAPQPQPSNS